MITTPNLASVKDNENSVVDDMVTMITTLVLATFEGPHTMITTPESAPFKNPQKVDNNNPRLDDIDVVTMITTPESALFRQTFKPGLLTRIGLHFSPTISRHSTHDCYSQIDVQTWIVHTIMQRMNVHFFATIFL
jgi:hypothetical protein